MRWRLKSPASRLFTQPFIQARIKENIKAPRHRPFCGEFPAQMASNAENVSIWWRHDDSNRPPIAYQQALDMRCFVKVWPTFLRFMQYRVKIDRTINGLGAFFKHCQLKISTTRWCFLNGAELTLKLLVNIYRRKPLWFYQGMLIARQELNEWQRRCVEAF